MIGVEIASKTPSGADFHGGPAHFLAAGRAGDDIDGAADRVAAIERALGAAQYLHTFDVGQVPVLTDLPAQIDAVHVNGNARICGDQMILKADTPDEGIGR